MAQRYFLKCIKLHSCENQSSGFFCSPIGTDGIIFDGGGVGEYDPKADLLGQCQLGEFADFKLSQQWVGNEEEDVHYVLVLYKQFSPQSRICG